MSWKSKNGVYLDSSGQLVNDELKPIVLPGVTPITGIADVPGLQAALDTKGTVASVTAVSTDLDTAEGEIDTLQTAVAALQANGDISGVTYGSSGLSDGKVTAYSVDGVSHVVTYPNSTTVVDVGGGKTRTATLDGDGNITGIVTT